MKFFHLSDLHIGKQLHHYNMKQEQIYILDKIIQCVKQEQPDAVIIAGDIYDKSVPSAEAVTIFDDFLTELSELVPVIAISGNHDSAERLDYASHILAKHKVFIAGMPPRTEEDHLRKVVLEDEWGEVNFYLLPFVKPFFVRNVFPDQEIDSYNEAVKLLLERENIDLTKRNVIVSHQFYCAGAKQPDICDSEIKMVGGIDEVDAGLLEPFEYAALGHIHGPQRMGKDTIRYSGTPLKYSTSEEHHKKSITVVEVKEKGTEPIISTIPLQGMRDVRTIKGNLEDVLMAATEENKDDFVSIVLTDEVDPYKPKERLEEIYSHILEIRIDNARTRGILQLQNEKIEVEDPMTVFTGFFEEMQKRKMTEQEQNAIEQIINGVLDKEANR